MDEYMELQLSEYDRKLLINIRDLLDKMLHTEVAMFKFSQEMADQQRLDGAAMEELMKENTNGPVVE